MRQIKLIACPRLYLSALKALINPIKHANRAIQSADLLIALGMRFDDRVTGHVPTFAPYARIIHVDIDPAEIGKNVAVEIPIVGDVKRVLRALIPQIQLVDPERRAAYLAELAVWRAESEKTPWHGSGAWRNGALSFSGRFSLRSWRSWWSLGRLRSKLPRSTRPRWLCSLYSLRSSRLKWPSPRCPGISRRGSFMRGPSAR